jgi:hypothetical protein
MARENYGICGGMKVALLLSSFLPLWLLFSVATNADTCLKLGDNTAEAIVSGRITVHHKLPKGSELRAGAPPWLMLDKPLLATPDNNAEFCAKYQKIHIIGGDDDVSQAIRWANQHVIIEGKLGRHGSALVSPAIFIEIKTIKKD